MKLALIWLAKLLGSNFNQQDDVQYEGSGFVGTVLDSCNRHYNLVIRPDGVWIAILTQLSLHVNARAEELRSKFVAHEGQKEILLKIPPTTIQGINWDVTGDRFAHLLDDDVVDKDLKVGISTDLNSEPLNGLRHNSEDGTTGWFIWSGEYEERDDFFKPIHAEHLLEKKPEVIKYLGLDVGFRFLIGKENYEDVWFDKKISEI